MALLSSRFHIIFIVKILTFSNYKVPLTNLQISTLIEQLESKKDELAISDWGISQSSLEDVFLEIVNAAENEQ